MKAPEQKRILLGFLFFVISTKKCCALFLPGNKIFGNRLAALSSKGLKGSVERTSGGIVSFLTFAVNSLQRRSYASIPYNGTAPLDRIELMNRIKRDYTERNYLWTGDIDYSSFDENCCFSDPTIKFNGTDTFARNIDNLRPIVDAWVSNGRSELLSIRVTASYVESRWNMVGDLHKLPWKARINVIGRTKFWFNDKYRIFFYDEKWELPAWKALLQLLTTPGKINSTMDY